MGTESLYESFEQDMYRSEPSSPTLDACNCCTCMWNLLNCFRIQDPRRNHQRRRSPTTTANQYRAPAVDTYPSAEVAVDGEDDIRVQERGQLLPKDGHASAPAATRSGSSDFELKGETSGLGTRTARHKKGSKGSGSFLEEIMNAAGLGKGMTLQDDEDICPTCLDPYTSDNPKIWTRCGHHFHMPCIYEWMERKDTCPMCESKMDLLDEGGEL